MKNLAIITSHPIQYNAPFFRKLAERKKVNVKVFYTWGQTKDGIVYDPDFGKEFKWDIPLLHGYNYEFIENYSKKPGANSFWGIKNRDLVDRVIHFKPDAVLVYGWSFASHLNFIRLMKKKALIIFRGDSTLIDESLGFDFKKLLRRVFLKWVYKHIDIALYTGLANKNYYLKHGLSEKQLIWAPHSIDIDRFMDKDGSYRVTASDKRKELGIAEDSIVFLFAGKLEPKKDPLFLIESFKEIKDEDIRLIIAGNGVLEHVAKKYAHDDKRIIFLGFQNQSYMPVLYRIADVYILPSRGPGETWGLSVNEAMSCARPVIMSDRCGCSFDLLSSANVVFQSGKKESLKSAILLFCKAGKRASNMIGEANISVISEWSFEKFATVCEQVVNNYTYNKK